MTIHPASRPFALLCALVFALVLPAGKSLAQTAPALQSAASRKSHGGVNYDLGLPLSGNSGIDPRNLATGLTVVFNFDKNVASATAAVTGGVAAVQSTSASGNQILVNLVNVANAQGVTVSLSNVLAAGGSSPGTASVTFRTLEGDVNGSG